MRQQLLTELAETIESLANAGRPVRLAPEIAALAARALRAYDYRLKELGAAPRLVPVSRLRQQGHRLLG